MPQILDRLVSQLKAKGMDPHKAFAVATGTLERAGVMDKHGNLTPKGRVRQAMGAAGRAKDRAARAAGRSPDDYVYDPKTNLATLKGSSRG